MKQPANGASGLEYLVDAYRCDPAALRSRGVLEQVFARLIEDLGLRPVAQPLWHVFPAPAGITGLRSGCARARNAVMRAPIE